MFKLKNTKKVHKTVFRELALLLALVLCVAELSGLKTDAHAASAKMKDVNVSWDLKNDETLVYKTYYAGIKMTNQQIRMTDYEVKDSEIEGYKECSFTLTYLRQWDMSNKQIHKICQAGFKAGSIGGGYWFTAVDYDTGVCLETENNYNVTVENSGWSYSAAHYYFDEQTESFWIKNPTVKVKIQYPKDYKGLCIGVGGHTGLKDTTNDTKFWDGEAAFGKTSLYGKKDKQVAHFMRVQ